MKAAVLRVFYAALMREAHRLTGQPEIYWQQIFNRLQWEGSEVRQQLEAEYQKRTRAGSKVWLRTRMPFRESRFLIRTLAGHSSGVNSCTVGRDGRTLVSGSDDYSVNIWDLTTGQVRLTLLGSPGPVTSCAVSADGSLVVAADLTGSICAWSALTGELYYTLATNEVAIYGCDFSPDDRLLATACADGVVRLWNLEQRRIVAEMPGHERQVHDCKFMPDGEHLVSAGEDGTLRLWNTQGRAAVASLKATSYHSLRACAVSRSGRLVAAVDDRAVLTVWDIDSRSIVCESRKDAGHHPFYWAAPGRSGVLGCAIDPNEKFAVSPGYDRTLSVWEISSGKALASLEGHTGWVKSCAITTDGQVLVSACSDHTLMLWDLSSLQGSGGSGRFLRYQPIKGCAFSADGWRAVSTCEDKSLTVWDVNQNTELRTFSGHHYNDFLDCAIDPEGKVVVTTSTDNTLVVRDIENGALVATLTGHDLAEYPYFGVYACSFSTGGRLLLSAGGDRTLKLWDTTDWRNTGTLEGHTDRVFGCAITRSGSEAVSAGFDSTVRIWDLATLTERATLRGHKGPAYCCAVSPDDRFILSGGGGGKISRDFKLRLWELSTGRLMGALQGHSAPVRACAFSPDGAYCLSASEDGTLRVWSVETLSNLATFFLSGRAYCVGFHSWRPLVGCGDEGGNFFLLDLAGVELGPTVVTGWHSGTGTTVRCPACGLVSALDRTWLGQIKTCTGAGCGVPIRVNEFVSRV